MNNYFAPILIKCWLYRTKFPTHLLSGLEIVQDVSYIIALLSALLLLGSGVAGWNVFRSPQLQPVVGRPRQDTLENGAAIALVAAFGLSLVAASLAVFARIF